MSWLRLGRAAALALVAIVGLDASAFGQERKPGPLGPQSGPYREQEWFIAWERQEKTWLAHAKIFRPPGEEKRPLALIAHGAPRTPTDRIAMKPGWADVQSRWFAAQGFVVVVPMRRGYGQSDGPFSEGSGSCETPDYLNSGLTTANDVQGILRHMVKEPYVDETRIVIVGQSAGGLGSLAVASRNPPGVIGIINFAGGRGSATPGTNCGADKLVEAVETFGKTARVPSLWIYTTNDTFFGPALSRQMANAFIAGGGNADYRLLGSFEKDGHSLFHNPTGMGIWTPLVTEFLRRLQLMS